MAFDTPPGLMIFICDFLFMEFIAFSPFCHPSSTRAKSARAMFRVQRLQEFLLKIWAYPLKSSPIPRSKGLILPIMNLDGGIIVGTITMHHNDTVSVILSCSNSLVKFDFSGLVILASEVVRIEERLGFLIDFTQEKWRSLQFAAKFLQQR